MIILVTPQIFVPQITQEFPQVYAYDTLPMDKSIPQIPIGQPMVGTMQTPFKGQSFQNLDF